MYAGQLSPDMLDRSLEDAVLRGSVAPTFGAKGSRIKGLSLELRNRFDWVNIQYPDSMQDISDDFGASSVTRYFDR